jgi:hypothetical protein
MLMRPSVTSGAAVRKFHGQSRIPSRSTPIISLAEGAVKGGVKEIAQSSSLPPASAGGFDAILRPSRLQPGFSYPQEKSG